MLGLFYFIRQACLYSTNSINGSQFNFSTFLYLVIMDHHLILVGPLSFAIIGRYLCILRGSESLKETLFHMSNFFHESEL